MTGSASAQTPIAVRVATSPQAATAEAFFAEDLGNFKKYGLDVHIQTLGRGTGSATTAVVVGKSADIGEADVISLCSATEHGIPLALLAPSNSYIASSVPLNVLVVAKGSALASGKDLDGKTLAVPSIVGPAKVAAAKWIDTHGGDVGTVKFVELPYTTMAGALASGTINAAMISEPSFSSAGDGVHVIAHPFQDEFGKEFQLSYWFASPEWAKANSDAVHRFALAMRDTAAWTNDPKNAQRYKEILQKYTHFPDDAIAKMGRATYGETIDSRLAEPLTDSAMKFGPLKKSCNVKELIAPGALTAR